jgi:hypothetical protein
MTKTKRIGEGIFKPNSFSATIGRLLLEKGVDYKFNAAEEQQLLQMRREKITVRHIRALIRQTRRRVKTGVHKVRDMQGRGART